MRRGAPAPPGVPVLGHLWHWSAAPLRLLETGARLGPVFRLELWRPALVGYSPSWNRALLTDLDTFHSRGSLSGLTPYLRAGVVHTDAPEHRTRRRGLNRHFGARGVDPSWPVLRQLADAHRPCGSFDACGWARTVVRRMLNAVLFGGALPDRLLARFLGPLDHALPGPMLPRWRLFHVVDTAIARALDDPPHGSVAAHLAGRDSAVTDLRVALAAGYDTTSHTLAWALWHLADHPERRHPDVLPLVVDEVLRHRPAGWLGSRVAVRDTVVDAVRVPAGTLVLYSPYLTHHDPTLWSRPHEFRPDRFRAARPGWGYLPFAAGPRTCLGAHLARLLIGAALAGLGDVPLHRLGGDPRPRTGLTLRPRGPLLLRTGT